MMKAKKVNNKTVVKDEVPGPVADSVTCNVVLQSLDLKIIDRLGRRLATRSRSNVVRYIIRDWAKRDVQERIAKPHEAM